MQLTSSSLTPSCESLRTGQHLVHLYVDPERAPAVLARLKSVSGVIESGWIERGYSASGAVRFPAANWVRDNGTIKKDELATEIAKSAANAFNAQIEFSKWNMTTGELMLKLKRTQEPKLGTGVFDVISVRTLIGPETLISKLNLIAWIKSVTIDTVDYGSEPRLKLLSNYDRDVQDQLTKILESTLAGDLGGRIWDRFIRVIGDREIRPFSQ
jgi:hypothetical protein